MNLFKSFLCFLVWIPITTYAQKSSTTVAVASFIVNAPAMDVAGENRHAYIELDFKTGVVKAHMQVDSFQFPDNFSSKDMNAVIKRRFREYYMESDLHPVIIFEGKITNPDKSGYQANGSYLLDISGYLTMHGIKKYISVQTVLTVTSSRKSIVSNFVIDPEDYKIRLPGPIIGPPRYFKKVNIRVSANL